MLPFDIAPIPLFFGFFDTIIQYIETIWSFVTNLIDSLFTFIQTLTTVTLLPSALVVFMPSFLTASIVSVASIAVIKVVIGR